MTEKKLKMKFCLDNDGLLLYDLRSRDKNEILD